MIHECLEACAPLGNRSVESTRPFYPADTDAVIDVFAGWTSSSAPAHDIQPIIRGRPNPGVSRIRTAVPRLPKDEELSFAERGREMLKGLSPAPRKWINRRRRDKSQCRGERRNQVPEPLLPWVRVATSMPEKVEHDLWKFDGWWKQHKSAAGG